MMAKVKTSKGQQLSRGQRKHVRRLKQEAQHAGTVYRSPFGAARAPAVSKKEPESQKAP